MSQTIEIEYTIEKVGDSYSLASKYRETRLYSEALTNPNPWDQVVSLVESPYCKLRFPRVRYNGKALNKDRQQVRNWTGTDVFLSDTIVREYFVAESFEARDEVVIDYQVMYDGIQFLPVVEVPNLGFVRNLRVRFRHPQSVRVDLESFFSRDEIPYSISRDKLGVTELVIEEIPPFESLTYFPFNGIHAAFLPSISDNGHTVDISTPQAFRDWYQKNLDLDPVVPEDYLQFLGSQLSPEDDDLQRLETIYDFVRTKIRYLADVRGENAYWPHAPTYTLNRGYGDCKDRAYAVQAIARAFGIRVDLALVSTTPKPRFRGSNLAAFDHMICAYETTDAIQYFDPTCQYCEFENLPSASIGSQVLRLASSAQWPATIPAPRRGTTLEVSLVGSIDSIEAVATIVIRNDHAFAIREAKARLGPADMENFTSAMINSAFYSLSLSRFVWLEEFEDSVRIEARADLSKFKIETENKIYLPKTPFRVAAADILVRAQDDAILYLDSSPASIELDLKLTLEGHEVELGDLFLGQTGKTSFAARASAADGSHIDIRYSFSPSGTRFELQEKRQLIEFFAEYLKSRNKLFAFNKKRS